MWSLACRPRCVRFREDMPTKQMTAEERAKVFKALSDPRRVENRRSAGTRLTVRHRSG